MNSATSNAVISRFGSALVAGDASAGGCIVSAVCADSVYVVFLIGTPPHMAASNMWFDTWFSGLTNRVGMVRREDDRPAAIDSRGGLGKTGFRAWRSTHARIARRAGGQCVADVRDASNSERPCRASSRSKKPRATVNLESPDPRWCA